MSLMRCSPSLFAVALHARTDKIFPAYRAALTAGNHMVQGQFTGRKMFTAILAVIPVTGEYVLPIQFHTALWQPIIKQQSNNPRNSDAQLYRVEPIVLIWSEPLLKFGNLDPVGKIVIVVLTLIADDHLCNLAAQQRHRPSYIDHTNSHVMFVQYQNPAIQSCSYRNHNKTHPLTISGILTENRPDNKKNTENSQKPTAVLAVFRPKQSLDEKLQKKKIILNLCNIKCYKYSNIFGTQIALYMSSNRNITLILTN